MIADILVFCALLILILIGYGVCAVIIQMPWRSFDDHTLVDIVYRPTFMVFGETFLDALQGESDCLDPDSFKNCTQNTYFSLVFLGLYLLVCNILLVNLLIAMMSSTYERVNEEAMQIWSLQNTDLLEEYRDKFPLPAPINLAWNVWRIGRAAQGKICGLCFKGDDKDDSIANSWKWTYGEFLRKHFHAFIDAEQAQMDNRFDSLFSTLKSQSSSVDGLTKSMAHVTSRMDGGGSGPSDNTGFGLPGSKKSGTKSRRRTNRGGGTSSKKKEDDPLAAILNDSD